MALLAFLSRSISRRTTSPSDSSLWAEDRADNADDAFASVAAFAGVVAWGDTLRSQSICSILAWIARLSRVRGRVRVRVRVSVRVRVRVKG